MYTSRRRAIGSTQGRTTAYENSSYYMCTGSGADYPGGNPGPYARDLGIPDDREDESKKDNENK